MLVRYAGYRMQSDAIDSNAALEADVMRFMAILGFCLLVVFALVQTLPMQKTEKIEIESEQILQARLQELSTKLDNLQQQNTQLSHQRNQLTGDLAKQDFVKQKQRAALLEKLRRQKNKLLQLHGLLSDDRTELSRVRRQLEMSESGVAVLKREFDQQNQNQKSTQKQTELVSEERVGFSLHFTNQAAFEVLVDKQTISVFYFSAKNSWRVLGNTRFIEQALPNTYYQMASETIPEALQMAAKKYTAAAQWAVVLDAAMIETITHIMSQNKGGELEITAAGKVELNL